MLGNPDVEVDGRPLTVDTRKAVALLFYLVVEKSASRDSLAGLFWADSSQERARATLRRTLSALRAAAGDCVEADRSQVLLVGEVESDLASLDAELEATSNHDHDAHDVCSSCIPHLRRATDLYRGDFLEGFSLKASPEFDDWVRSIAESTRLKVGEAFMRLGTALAADGDYPDAIGAVSRWIDLDNLHEPAHRMLMLLHAWAGDRPGAMAAYRNCVTVMENELGVPPLEETTELYEAILDEDLPPAPGGRRRVKAKIPPPRHTDLVGRETELQVLRSEALETSGAVVTLRGAPWMGKTRLLEELAAEAGSTRTVLVGRAFRMEQTLPYGVAAQILRGAIGAAGPADLPGWAYTEVGRVLPELGPDPAPSPLGRFGELRLLEAAHAVLATVASARPLLILLDDVQWMDVASAEVVSYLGRRLPGEAISIVAAARSGDVLPPPMTDLMSGADRTITVEPLTVDDIRPLAGDRARAEEIRQRTGGVPLLVTEALASETTEAETPGMHRYMESRLAEVSELAHQILTAASVLDGLCEAGLLRETSGRSEEEVVSAVEELVGRGLLREMPESSGLGFTLDALERLTYDSTSLVRRRLLHRRAARAMAEKGAATTDVRLASSIAAQLAAAGDADAAGWFRRAGDLARKVYANDMAADFYENAIALGYPETAPLRLALGEIAMAAGDYHRARHQLTLAGPHSETGLGAQVEHRIGEVERLLGRFDLAAEHYARAVPGHPAPAAVLSDWALLAHRTGDSAGARKLAADAAAHAGTEPSQLSRVSNILAVVTPEPDEAMRHVDEAIELAGTDEPLRMAALNTKAQLLARLGDADGAVALIHEAIGLADRTGHRHRQAALWNHLADVHHRAGREGESREALTQAVSLFADIDSGDLEPEVWLLSTW